MSCGIGMKPEGGKAIAVIARDRRHRRDRETKPFQRKGRKGHEGESGNRRIRKAYRCLVVCPGSIISRKQMIAAYTVVSVYICLAG
jgi:hypothetical protein